MVDIMQIGLHENKLESGAKPNV